MARPVVKFECQTLTPKECKELVLTRGYICRRRLARMPFVFDYLAHSAQLFDAHVPDQAEELERDPEIRLNPVTSFLFERLEDRDDPETGSSQPYFDVTLTEIREVDIGEPYFKWYQHSRDERRKKTPTKAWYQWDSRNYEFFRLDGYEWTKQLIGGAVSLTLNRLESLAKEHGQEAYDLARNTCHDTREHVMEDLGVVHPGPRPITRVTNSLRPYVSEIASSSARSANSTAS